MAADSTRHLATVNISHFPLLMAGSMSLSTAGGMSLTTIDSMYHQSHQRTRLSHHIHLC